MTTPTTSKSHQVRISDASLRALQELADSSGLSMTAIIDRAIDQYRRTQIFAQAAAVWQAMGDEMWTEYVDLEGSVADGLEHHE